MYQSDIKEIEEIFRSDKHSFLILHIRNYFGKGKTGYWPINTQKIDYLVPVFETRQYAYEKCKDIYKRSIV